jgi:hypothetical protein
LSEWNKEICHKTGAVHFGIIWESVDNIEAARIPYDRKHEFFALNIMSRFLTTSSLDRVHMGRGDVLKKIHDSSSVTR